MGSRGTAVALAACAIWLFSCSNGGGSAAPEAKSGEACEEEAKTQCGVAASDTEAVLICVAAGTESKLKWTEQKVCTRYQECENASECVVDCTSGYLCDDRECGDDNCGGSCGECPDGLQCLGGHCTEVVCDPACGDAHCGPDGCGGECGECSGGQVCTFPTLQCVGPPEPCAPVCKDRECGPNECGGSCGTCGQNLFCSPADLTCKPPCVPDCTGKQCGDDGCGGSCGGCAEANEFCHDDGTCGPCDPISNTLCPPGQYCTYAQDEGGATTGPLCEEAGTQKYGEPCGGQDACAEGICISLGETGSACYQFCQEHSDCGEGKQCIELQNATYQVCNTGAAAQEKCNLLEQKCTLEEEACYFDDGAGEPICLPAGAALEGEKCSGQPNDCAAGLTCASYSTSWTCHKFCNTLKGQEPTCDPDGGFPKCANYYAKQHAGFCNKE